MRIQRLGDFAILYVDGGGAYSVPAMDLLIAQKWASARTSCGSAPRDRDRFFEKLDVLSARAGSPIASRGSPAEMLKLARTMLSAGSDVREFQWPLEVQRALAPPKPVPPKSKVGSITQGGSADHVEGSVDARSQRTNDRIDG